MADGESQSRLELRWTSLYEQVDGKTLSQGKREVVSLLR
jgi:hypothetical protein